MDQVPGAIELSLRGHIRHQSGEVEDAARYGNLEHKSTYRNHQSVSWRYECERYIQWYSMQCYESGCQRSG